MISFTPLTNHLSSTPIMLYQCFCKCVKVGTLLAHVQLLNPKDLYSLNKPFKYRAECRDSQSAHLCQSLKATKFHLCRSSWIKSRDILFHLNVNFFFPLYKCIFNVRGSFNKTVCRPLKDMSEQKYLCTTSVSTVKEKVRVHEYKRHNTVVLPRWRPQEKWISSANRFITFGSLK